MRTARPPAGRSRAWRALPGAGGSRQAGADRRVQSRLCRAARAAPAIGADHRIVVDVHHARVRRDRLCHLVHAVLRGQARAEVEELADPRLSGQEADHAADERPVVADDPRDVGEGGEQLLRGLPVGGEIIPTPVTCENASCAYSGEYGLLDMSQTGETFPSGSGRDERRLRQRMTGSAWYQLSGLERGRPLLRACPSADWRASREYRSASTSPSDRRGYGPARRSLRR
jgi:hypothetical protein